jgi:hypothetical protein
LNVRMRVDARRQLEFLPIRRLTNEVHLKN